MKNAANNFKLGHYLEFSTHSAGGLTESDFILAAKVDELQE